MKDIEKWQEIREKLTDYLGICGCQRKLKTIIDNLVSIHDKCIGAYNNTHERDFTGAEWLVIAMLNSGSDAIIHAINCEYPIINEDDKFWKWILEIKDSPYLEDY